MLSKYQKTASLTLTQDRSQELRRLVNAQIARLNREGRQDFNRDMTLVEEAVDRGDKAEAVERLDRMIMTYGLDNLVNEAKARLADI